MDLTWTSLDIFVKWDNNSIEFYKDDSDEPTIKYENIYKDEHDTFDAVYKIINTITEVNEKYDKECKKCWIEKISRIFDIDWTNLEEISFCPDCLDWKPYIKE
jgi:hypothetical protein